MALCLVNMLSCGQTNSEIDKFLNENFSTLSLSYIVFFEEELVRYAQDSSNRIVLLNKLDRQRLIVNKSSPEASKERLLFLSILRKRLQSVATFSESQLASKNFILENLEWVNLDFPIEENFVRKRLDKRNRGLPFGDEECDVDFSYYIFFLYDPVLFVRVSNSLESRNPNGRIYFPIPCYLEELSNVPIEMKQRTQKRLLEILENYKGNEYSDLAEQIKRADLEASYD